MKRKVVLIGVPSDLGVDNKGSEIAPHYIRKFLIPLLKLKGIDFTDLGDVIVPCWDYTNKKSNLKNIHQIKQMYTRYSELCQKAFATESLPIILGGDHSITFGNVQELTKYNKVGLIWLDAHGDFNTEQTTQTGNIHGMVLNAITGNALKSYLGLKKPLIKEENISLLGVRDLDYKEKVLLKKSNVMTASSKELDNNLESIVKTAVRRANQQTQGYHVSMDLDIVDPQYAPGVSVPVEKGISPSQLYRIIDLVNSKNLLSLDFVETNPKYDQNNKTSKLIASCILRLCS